MSFKKSLTVRTALFGVLILLAVMMAPAQTPSLVIVGAEKPKAVAVGNNLYSAGFIQSSAISTANKIIAGQGESDQYYYATNDFVYINMGNDKGVNVGDTFSVVRPRAEVKSKWTNKDVGFYVQELGALEVVAVKANVAVARVKAACDNFLLGDLVQLAQRRTSPTSPESARLDRFADATGKATGRILMARDGAEMLSRDFIAYVDLGADENVQIGDRLTIFRPLEKGNLGIRQSDHDGATARDYGFQSLIYAGGKFSNQAPRKSGDRAGGQEVTTHRAKQARPFLRKVVGEAVVLNVKERTATVVITRTAQEIHTGDWVEIK